MGSGDRPLRDSAKVKFRTAPARVEDPPRGGSARLLQASWPGPFGAGEERAAALDSMNMTVRYMLNRKLAAALGAWLLYY